MERSATRRRWERDCRELVEVWIVDETDSFRLDSVKKIERRFRSTTPRHESSTPEKDGSGICISLIVEKVRNSHGL